MFSESEKQLALQTMHTTQEVLTAKVMAEPAQVARKIYQIVDKTISRHQELLPIQCVPGCDMCCHYRVVASAPEILAIAEYISGYDHARYSALMARLQEHVKRVESLGPAQQMRTNNACPFLESKKCSIYPLRPMSCRTHHEAVDRSSCATTFANPSNPSNGSTHGYVEAMRSGIRLVLNQVLISAKADPLMYELGAGVLSALNNKSSLKRYRGGKKSFPDVKDCKVLGGDDELL